MQQREWVFEGIAPLKYLNPCNKNRRASLAHLLSDYFVGKSLSLVSCSPAELTSVSASNPEFHYTKLYLQSAEFSSHFQMFRRASGIRDKTPSLKGIQRK
jgi:hypothetical protein